MYGERPLPPLPSVQSSSYTSSRRDTAPSNDSSGPPGPPGAVASQRSLGDPSVTSMQSRTVAAKDLRPAKHLSQLYKKGTRGKSGTTNTAPERRHFDREVQPNEGLKTKAQAPSIKPVPFTEWKAPSYHEPCTSSKSSIHTSTSRSSSSSGSPNLSLPVRGTADERAASYFAVMYQTQPTNFARDTNVNSEHANSSLPSRTIASVPYPILTDLPMDSPPRSRFSPSSPNASYDESLPGVASSLRSRAKKAFFQTKTLKRPGLKHRFDSSHSETSHVSPTTIHPAIERGSTTATTLERDSMEQSLSEAHDTSHGICTPAKRTPDASKMPKYSGGDQLSPPKKQLLTKRMHSPDVPLAEYLKYRRQVWKEPGKTPYVRRVPRKRLPKPQLSAPSPTVATSKPPDTTYKIEMPLPPTPKRPKTTLLFDHTYHLELVSPPVLNLTRSSSVVLSTPTNATKAHRLSHSITGSTSYENQYSNRLSRAGKQHMDRYSLPLATHTRQNSHNTALSRLIGQPTDQYKGSNAERSLEWELASTVPVPHLITRETKSVTASALDSGREWETRRREGTREEAEGKGREVSSEERREELKKRIVVMGDPSAVGVPF